MVRLRPAGPREGRRGKLSGDPAVQAAAVALLEGVGDPLGFLAAAPEDARILAAIVREAGRMRAEREQQLADYVAAKASNHVVSGFARIQGRFMKWMSRRG